MIVLLGEPRKLLKTFHMLKQIAAGIATASVKLSRKPSRAAITNLLIAALHEINAESDCAENQDNGAQNYVNVR